MSSVAVKLALVGLHTRPRLARAVHFGWDFAPPLPSLGIWKGLRLRAFSSAAIDSVLVTTAIVAGRRPDSPTDAAGWAGITWETSFTVFITGAGAAPTHGVLRIDLGSGLATASVNVSLPPGPSTQRISCNVTGAAPWWPRTLGAAPLYNATVTLVADVLGAGVRLAFAAPWVSGGVAAHAPRTERKERNAAALRRQWRARVDQGRELGATRHVPGTGEQVSGGKPGRAAGARSRAEARTTLTPCVLLVQPRVPGAAPPRLRSGELGRIPDLGRGAPHAGRVL